MELNAKAWDEWEAYRKGIKHMIKPQSMEAMKLKLMRFGDGPVQQSVVDQSIAQGWQGLFAIDAPKNDPTAPKTRTKAQAEADNANFAYMNRESEKHWDKRLSENPILAKLQMAAALLARYDTEADQGSVLLDERRTWLKERVAALLRECQNPHVLNDYAVRGLVLRLFNAPGLRRLESRSHQEAA